MTSSINNNKPQLNEKDYEQINSVTHVINKCLSIKLNLSIDLQCGSKQSLTSTAEDFEEPFKLV